MIDICQKNYTCNTSKQNYLLYEESPIWFHFYFNWIFPVNKLSKNEKKSQLIHNRHTRQIRCMHWYIFCHKQCGQVPLTFDSVLSHSNHRNSLGYLHIWFPQKDLCRKKDNICRVTNLMVFFLTLIVIITKSVCEALFSTLAFDLELSLPVTFNEVFNFHQKQQLSIFLSPGHKIYYASHYQQFLVSINKAYLSFEKTWLPLSHKYLTCWWSKYRSLNSSCNQIHM